MNVAALLGVIQREFKRVVRQRARLVSTFARPVIWLVIIGSGFSALIPGGSFSYHKFLLPGIIGMVILFSSLLSALGSVHDREFGSMRMLLIAPVPRWVIVLGKTVSSALVGVVFALILSPLAWLFHIDVGFVAYLGFIGAALLTSVALASLGMLVASRIRQLENFAVAMNFVIFPMFFLSGALYPTTKLPGYLQPLVHINPLTYGVDLMRNEMLGTQPVKISHLQYAPSFDVAFLLAFTIVALALAARLFGTDEHLAPTFLSATPRRAVRRAAAAAPAPAPVADAALAVTLEPAADDAQPTGSPVLGTLESVVDREFKRVFRQRGRLVSTFARPLLWLVAVGYGFAALIPGGGYHRYLMPGIIGMVILFSCMLSALGSVHDRQFGPMRMLLLAPVHRSVIVFGKTISAAMLGSMFAIVLSPLAWAFGIDAGFGSYLGFLGAVVLTAIALSSLGMLAASRIRQLEDFAVAMNFVIFPMFFLSGALYPANKLPIYLQPIVRINPLTYGVDLMRQTLLASQSNILSPVQFGPWLDVGFLVAFSIVAIALASRLFGLDDHLAPMFLSGEGGNTTLIGRLRGMRPRLAAQPVAATAGVETFEAAPAPAHDTHPAPVAAGVRQSTALRPEVLDG